MPTKSKRVSCNLCKAKITDDLKHRWEHVAKVHTDVLASRILPILETAGKGLFRLGECFGEVLAKDRKP